MRGTGTVPDTNYLFSFSSSAAISNAEVEIGVAGEAELELSTLLEADAQEGGAAAEEAYFCFAQEVAEKG